MAEWHVALSERAKRDFSKAIERSADDFGTAQARLYIVTLHRALKALADGPALPGSTDRSQLRPGLRSLHVARLGRRGRHLLLYRIKNEHTIEVVRILHDAMDFERHLPADGN
jgi:toxin ParE1/3/4